MVVDPGLTTRDEPVTVPMPLSIEMLVAFVTLQLRVDDCPAWMVGGEAVKLLITGAAPLELSTLMKLPVGAFAPP